MKTIITKPAAWLVLSGLLMSSTAHGTDCFNSEASHFLGTTALSSATTYGLFTYFPKVKYPAIIGFGVGTAAAFIGEIPLDKDAHFSALDALVGTAGAAVGSFSVHQWYITPRVQSSREETTYAVMATHKF